MEYHHDVAEAKDPSPANFSMSDMNSKFVDDNSTDENESFELINETPENVVSIARPKSCYDFSQTVSGYSASNIAHHNIAERSNYSSFVNTSIPDVNSQSVDNPSDSDESFEFINDTSDNGVFETKRCYGPQNVSSITLHDTEESNYSLTATASTPNASFPSKDNPTYDESFELINETSEELVYVMKSEKLYDPQNVSPNSTSNLESCCDIAEDKKFAWFSDVSILDINSLSVDSDESFELINETPEKVLCSKETQQFYNPENVSSISIFNMESVHNTVFEKKCSSPVEVCTNGDKPKQESKILTLIAERKKVSASKNIPECSERICADGLIMEGLIKGIKNCGIAEKDFIAANRKHNDQCKANVSMHNERPNPESKNLFHVAEKKHVSTPENVEMCSDMMKKVIKGIESCSIVDKQFNSNIAFDEEYSDEFKINPIVNKRDLVLPKNNLTFMNASDEKYDPKCSKTCMIAKGRKRCCDEIFCLPYDDISNGEKKEDNPRAEEDLKSSIRPLDIFFVRPKIPESVFVLRSNCLGYLKKPRQTNEDKNGFRSDYSAYCSDDGNRIAQDSKRRELAKELKDKRRKKQMKNFAHKWTIEKKNIFSWRGFHIDFL